MMDFFVAATIFHTGPGFGRCGCSGFWCSPKSGDIGYVWRHRLRRTTTNNS